MIYRDDPACKALKERAQALRLEIATITRDLDAINRDYHATGVTTPIATRMQLQADRSAARLELLQVETELFKVGEAFRLSGQNDLLDNLIAVCRENNNGQYLGAAMRRLEDSIFEEGTPV